MAKKKSAPTKAHAPKLTAYIVRTYGTEDQPINATGFSILENGMLSLVIDTRVIAVFAKDSWVAILEA